MRRLVDAREHLDGVLTDPQTLDGNLRDLRRVNRRFGGSALSLRALRAVTDGPRPFDGTGQLRVVDVGCGSADIPLAFTALDGPWASIHVTAVDSRPEILDAARRIDPRLAHRTDVELQVADGRSLPFADRAFDIAHASLVLHHLGQTDAVGFLRELARVSTMGIVINDLERGAANWLGTWLVLHVLSRNPYTLHDGPLSVRRAFTSAEMRDLLQEAGLRPVAQFAGFAGHRWAIGAVPA